MKISYKWLCDYLSIKLDKDEIGEILTSIGLEVEDVYYFEKYKGGLDGLIVGLIQDITPHPDANKLQVTKVYINENTTLQIVCGAKNIKIGATVIVAMDNTTIYPIQGNPKTIINTLIRGVDSMGMICSAFEIGLSPADEGVFIFDEKIEPGTPLNTIYVNYTDWIYNIGLTANRMDAMSHYGVAKDLYVYLTHHNKHVKLNPIYNYKLPSSNLNNPIKISIENKKDCLRYVGVYIKDIKVQKSPNWLQDKLLSIGLNPINNIVDITNFILHETGQPLHAFDAQKIKSNTIVVKNLKSETQFITLDNQEKKLTDSDLMITDGQTPLCLAGIYGGINSGINDETTNIFLESAYFNPIAIRKSAFHHNLRTDAASHFEKGIDISNCKNVLLRATQLIIEIAGGTYSAIEDIFPNPIPQTTINLKYSFLKKLSGNHFHPDKIKNLLKNLGFEIIVDSIDLLQVKVPYTKHDFKYPADLVEEIIRIDGLNNVPLPKHISFNHQIDKSSNKEKILNRIESFLIGNGYSEIITNSLTSSKYYNDLHLDICVKLLNSLSSELDILRPNLLVTGLEVVAYNLHRQQPNLKLFEIGKVYSNSNQTFVEEEQLGILVTGHHNIKNWNTNVLEYSFHDAKGVVEALFNLLGIEGTQWLNSEETNCIHILKDENVIGEIKLVEKELLKKINIKQPVYFISLHLTKILDFYIHRIIKYKEIEKYPSIERDLAIVVSKKYKYDDIKKLVDETNLPFLKNYGLFDLFEHEKIGVDNRSYGLNFVFQSEIKTLQDHEIETNMQVVQQLFIENLQATIRQ